MKKFFLTVSVVASLMGTAFVQSCGNGDSAATPVAGPYTYSLNESEVTCEHVTYKNRFGFTLSADLYYPKGLDKTSKQIAVVVGAPYGAVKEQGAGLYAMELARRGCVAVVFDHSFNGASSGEPRNYGSPEIFAEDYSSSIDFLGTLPYVDRERIAIIGLGNSAGFALDAAKVDKRIKAVVAINLVDLCRVCRYGYLDQEANDAFRVLKLSNAAKQRWADIDSGVPATTEKVPAQPVDSADAKMEAFKKELFNYYATKRGFHPRASAGFVKSVAPAFINHSVVDRLAEISPATVLFIVSENSFVRYMSDDAHRLCAEPKSYFVVPGATFTDLYDRTDLMPLNELYTFLQGIK